MPEMTPEELRDRRHRLGLTQQALAGALGLAATTVSRWERGERTIATPTLLRLALDRLETEPGASVAEPLPSADARLIGRERDLAAARRLIRDEKCRLLTLVGPGGVGKTVLGLEVGRSAALHRIGGGCLVELADLPAGSSAEISIVRALGAHQVSGDTIMDAIVRRLRASDMIIVLDNCEHVTSSVASIVAGILRRCPDVTIVATSRTPLHLRAERRWQVTPLMVPEVTGTPTAAALRRNPAVALFIERWGAVRAQHRLSLHELGAISEVCRSLDGLPLALELAATSTAAATVGNLIDLDPRPRWDCQGQAIVDQPSRHRSLEAVIDWSYRLLDPVCQTVFRRLSVFAGGMQNDCALEVVGFDLETEVVRKAISQLVDASMVIPAPGQRGRLRMLETVRVHAMRLLIDSGEEAQLRRRHADWFTRWAEQGAGRFESAEQASWLDTLDHEFGNIRSALTWCRGANSEPVTGLRLAVAFQRYWDMRGLLSEGEATLATYLDIVTDAVPARARGLIELAGFATRREDPERIAACAGEAQRIATRLGDTRTLARALAALGYAAFIRHEPTAAVYAQQALEAATLSGDATTVGHAHLVCGVAALGANRMDPALEHFDLTLEVARERGDRWMVSETGEVIALVHAVRGDFTAARRAGLESLTARFELLNRTALPLDLRIIGIADAALGAPDRAAVLFGAAAGIETATGRIPTTPWTALVEQAVEQSRTSLGEARFTDLWRLGQTTGDAEIWSTVRGSLPDGAAVPPGACSSAVNSLTRRELEVAELVAVGLTNPQISRRLGIAERTVGAHLEHIMTKLCIHSRSQIATWITRSASPVAVDRATTPQLQ